MIESLKTIGHYEALALLRGDGKPKIGVEHIDTQASPGFVAVTLKVDLVTITAEKLVEYYRKIRRDMLGRQRAVGQKHRALAVAYHIHGLSCNEWNAATKDIGWDYVVEAHFRQDAKAAKQRLLKTPKETCPTCGHH